MSPLTVKPALTLNQHDSSMIAHFDIWSSKAAGHSRDVELLGKAIDVLANLSDQLSCGCHDEGDGSIVLLNGPLVFDVPQQRQHKREGLPTASLGDADAVSPTHDDWKRLQQAKLDEQLVSNALRHNAP